MLKSKSALLRVAKSIKSIIKLTERYFPTFYGNGS